MNRISNAVSWTNDKLGQVCIVGLVSMVIVVTIEVVGRYAFNHPFKWTYELSQFLLAFTALLAGGHVLLKNQHIKVDIVYGRFSTRGKAINDLITFPLFIFWAGCFSYAAILWSSRSVAILQMTGSTWNVPLWPVKLLVPIGALLILAQGLVKLSQDISIIRDKAKPEPEKEAKEVGL
ncbi:TRAP transporter small permease subunit [Chloroflexota bacterium]